jgi:hypothetical protein
MWCTAANMRLDKKTTDQVLAAVQRGKHTWNYVTKSADNDIGASEFESKQARLARRMLEEAEQKEAEQKEAHRKRQQRPGAYASELQAAQARLLLAIAAHPRLGESSPCALLREQLVFKAIGQMLQMPQMPQMDRAQSQSPRETDIGVFENCPTGRPGLDLLLGSTPGAAPAAAVVSSIARQIGGRPGCRPHHIPKQLLSLTTRQALMRVLDKACAHEMPQTDVKIDLCREELERLVGVATVSRLAALFAEPFNEVKLRRTESVAVSGVRRGQCIAFHLDHSERTMQVPLNDPSDYEGGQLLFAMADGQLAQPARAAGTATIHSNGVVHGVSELRRGVRYALFLLRVPK